MPETLRGRLVVRLVLREVVARLIPAGSKSGTAEMLLDALREDISRRVGTEATRRLFSYLQRRLLKDGGVFLLDGLDEVPEAERRGEVLLGAIRTLVATLPDAARLLVTARPYAYADKKWHLPGFPILALAPFSPEQVERFIERWYRAARQPMGWSEETAGTKGGQLRDALRDRPYLGDLASRHSCSRSWRPCIRAEDNSPTTAPSSTRRSSSSCSGAGSGRARSGHLRASP